MSYAQGTPSFRNLQSSGRHYFLPLKCPLPNASASNADFKTSNFVDPKGNLNAREGLRMYKRTTSECVLLEEQPSWLDDLLNEPETLARRGVHRRSSSDSLAYLNVSSISRNADSMVHESYMQRTSNAMPSWGSQEFDHLKDMQHASYCMDVNSFGGIQSRGLESSKNNVTHPSGSLPSKMDKIVLPSSSSAKKKPHASSSTVMESQVQEGYGQDLMGSSDRREGSQAKHSQSEMEIKRAKQQFAQRSRVRKLQYIAELERNVQALQAEGLEFSAQLQFLDQQNLIMSLENKAMKQRLDCLVHEHLVKCLQHNMLGQEASRLQSLYHYQQRQQQQPPIHRCSKSTDLDFQFANLSLKGNESNSGPGQLQI